MTGRRFASGTLETGRRLVLAGSSGPIVAVAFSPDGAILATSPPSITKTAFGFGT